MTLISDRNQVNDALDSFGVLPEWLAAGMRAERVAGSLRDAVPEFRSGAATLVECQPERLRAKDGEWIARYRLRVASPDGRERDVVLVGNLVAPSQPAPPGVAPGVQGVALGQGAWSVWLPDLRLHLHHEETDVALPALPLLTEPDAVAALLEPVVRQAGHPEATITSCDPVVVRYKPGSRCTVVVGVEYAATPGPRPPSPVVLKTHQGDKGQTAWAAMTALWERPAAWRGIVEMAQPLAFLPEERILVQGPIGEELTLKELARQAFAGGDPELLARLRIELARTGRALAALHGSGAAYGRTATLEDEVAEIREVLDRLELTIPEIEGAAEPLLSRLEEVAQRHPADPVVPAHHDFRPAQVLLNHGRIGFIDFDGASMAEPALDLGRFMAKLRDIGISSLLFTGQPLAGAPLGEHLALMDSLCEEFLSAYERHATVSRERVLLWETCDLLTGLLHAWTKVRLLRVEPRLAVLQHHLGSSGLAS